MKKIINAVKNLSGQQVDRLRVLLKTKPSRDSSQEIISSLLSYRGLDLILSHLKKDELKVLNAVYSEKDGITFGELEKRENINIDKIEAVARGLSSKLLVYVLKNRQKLHNRLDKIFIIPELRDFLHPLKDDAISEYYKSIKSGIEKKKIAGCEELESLGSDSTSYKLLRFLFKSGGIGTLSESSKIVNQKNSETILTDLKKKSLITIYHDLSTSCKTYLFLNKDVFIYMSQNGHTEPVINENVNINNHFMFLLNLLNLYDIISTYGLFITRQKEFRKIDCTRLADSMYRIYDFNGKEIDRSDLFRLCLFIFYINKSITVKRDAVIISLKNIQGVIEDPVKFLLIIINSLQSIDIDNELFSAPFEVPSIEDIISIIKNINKSTASSYSYLRLTRILNPLSELKSREIQDISRARKDIKSNFNITMRFLCITGIIEIENGNVRLTETGRIIASKLLKQKVSKGQEPASDSDAMKKIYINPDFTLIVPQNEVPSVSLYHILAHTDIIKEDVIINARINKNSVLNAYKRGMSVKNFFSHLKKYSKLGIPQNLEFTINEWINQTVKLNIREVILLRASHSSFIDELAFSDFKAGLIERISPEHAVIDRRYLDRIIKFARKGEAVIDLFDESGED